MLRCNLWALKSDKMVKSQIMRTSAIKLLICLCYFKHLIKQNILKLRSLCITEVAKWDGYLLGIAVWHRLHLHGIFTPSVPQLPSFPACVEQWPHLQAASSTRTCCTGREAKTSRRESQILKVMTVRLQPRYIQPVRSYLCKVSARR